MLINKIIDINNENYKVLYKIAKYTFPVYYINENSVPTLCIYGGGDSIVDVAQYSYLKK